MADMMVETEAASDVKALAANIDSLIANFVTERVAAGAEQYSSHEVYSEVLSSGSLVFGHR